MVKTTVIQIVSAMAVMSYVHGRMLQYSSNMWITTSRTFLLCQGDTLKKFGQLNHTVNELLLRKCPLPENTYADDFRSLGLNVTGIRELYLDGIPGGGNKLHDSHFAGLSLSLLSISSQGITYKYSGFEAKLNLNKADRLVLNRFSPMDEYSEVLSGRIVTTKVDLPFTPPPQYSTYEAAFRALGINVTAISELNLGINNPKLEYDLFASHFADISLRVLSISFKRRRETQFDIQILGMLASSLEEFSLEDTILLPPLLEMHPDKTLILDAFSKLVKLQKLRLTRCNLIQSEDLAAVLKPLKALRILEINENKRLDFCSDKMSSLTSSIKHLSIQRTATTDLCFGRWDKLEYLNLCCKISNLKLNGLMLPSSRDHPLLVDLRGNDIKHLPDTKEDSDLMISDFKQAAKITILVDLSLDCDCQQGWFARALRSLSGLKMIGARCSSGEAVGDPQPELIKRIECDKTVCEGCVCRRSWDNNDTVADCSDKGMQVLPSLSHIPNLRTLLASDNKISTLRADIFTSTLLVADFSVNNISKIDAEVVEAMFREPKRKVSLSRNPLHCNCDNEPLLSALQAHSDQVADYDNMTCVGDAIKIRDVDVNALCKEARLVEGAAIGGLLLAGQF